MIFVRRLFSPGCFVLLCLGLFTLLLVGCSKEEAAPAEEVAQPVKVITIGESSGKERTFPGRIRANKRVDLAFQVSGPLEALPAEEGQMVKKGALVARILPRDFQTALSSAKANALEAEQQYIRYKELYVRKQVSKAQFDKAKSDHDVAQSNLKKAEDTLDDTSLRAPFSGVVAKRFVENFTEVQAKEPIISLQDITRIEVLVDVPERFMTDVRRGKFDGEVTAEFVAAPGLKFPLAIKEFATEADARTQTYEVVLVMDQPEEINVLPGMTASVKVINPTRKTTSQAIIVPAIAVIGDPSGKSYVWVVDAESNRVSKQEISTGELVGNDQVVVNSGVEQGTTIAVSGVNVLRDGMKIRPVAEVTNL